MRKVRRQRQTMYLHEWQEQIRKREALRQQAMRDTDGTERDIEPFQCLAFAPAEWRRD